MYSAENIQCMHWMGSPIRKSPDHRLLASPRGLSQLATSFIAYLRQGIHTHALSSLTIKFTLDTFLNRSDATSHRRDQEILLLALHTVYWLHGVYCNLLVVAHQYSTVKDHWPFSEAKTQ